MPMLVPARGVAAVLFSLSLGLFPFARETNGQAPPATLPATQPAQSRFADFLRFVDNGPAGGRLETADVVYVDPRGRVVRLVSAVHIAERSYFDGIAKDFALRDAVLYEMVKPKDADAPQQGQRTGSGIVEMQRFMKDTLGLEYQLDSIDYTRPNFVHADLDAETFQKLQVARGETFEMMFLQAMMKVMRGQDPDAAQPDLARQDPEKMLEDVIKLLTRPDSQRQIRAILARQISDIEKHGDALGLDKPGGSVIIHERNKAAISALESALKDGRKDVAIFYGAAHMPDMATRLVALGFKPVATEWRMAWDLTIRADQPSAVESALMELIRALGEQEW